MENKFIDEWIPENFHINSVYIHLNRAPTPLAKSPVYSLQIFNGGEVIYTGEHNVKIMGKAYGKTDSTNVFDILKMAIASNFYGLPSNIGLNNYTKIDDNGNIKHYLYSERTDIGTTTLEIRIESKTKKITHWGSCSQLEELESFIDVCCLSDRWTGQVGEY